MRFVPLRIIRGARTATDSVYPFCTAMRFAEVPRACVHAI